MLLECFFAAFGNPVSGVCFSPDKSLIDLNIAILFQWFNMGSQVAISYIHELFQVVKIYFLIYHKNAHDTQPHPAVKCFIKIFNRVVHTLSIDRPALIAGRSYLNHINIP